MFKSFYTNQFYMTIFTNDSKQIFFLSSVGTIVNEIRDLLVFKAFQMTTEFLKESTLHISICQKTCVLML